MIKKQRAERIEHSAEFEEQQKEDEEDVEKIIAANHGNVKKSNKAKVKECMCFS